ncbi:MAG: type II secretion system F family protein [Armatimonadota bacterium]
MELIIALLAFGTAALLTIGLTMRSERAIIRERLAEVDESATAPSAVDLEFEAAFRERVLLPCLRSLARIGLRLTPRGTLRSIEEKLEMAGRPWNLTARDFIGLRVLSLAVFIIIGLSLVKLMETGPVLELVMLILIVFIGAVLPDYLLQSAINSRQASIRRSLADTLDLLTVSVEAGLGLDGAMQKVVEKLKNPLSEELSRALREMQIGKLRAEALKDMASRVRVQELSSFVASICQAEQLGVSIARVLRVQGDTIRSQRSQRARETAAKLPVKMLFPLVFCIFPAIFVVIAGSGAISIWRAFSK